MAKAKAKVVEAVTGKPTACFGSLITDGWHYGTASKCGPCCLFEDCAIAWRAEWLKKNKVKMLKRLAVLKRQTNEIEETLRQGAVRELTLAEEVRGAVEGATAALKSCVEEVREAWGNEGKSGRDL